MAGASSTELMTQAGLSPGGSGHDFAEALIEATGFFIPTLSRTPLKGQVTDAQFQEAIRFILTGMRGHRAAKTAGIPRTTWKTALRRGQKDAESGDASRDATIWRTVSRAEGVMVTYLNGHLVRHAARDPKTALELRKALLAEDNALEVEIVDEADAVKRQRDRLRAALPRHSEEVAVIDAE